MTVADFGQIVHAPELVNERWWNRADATLTLRREVRREYPILTFLAAIGTVEAATIPQDFDSRKGEQ
jgi:hypothetical protein